MNLSKGVISLDRMLDLSEVKKVARRMTDKSILKQLILSEPDKIEAIEFYGKALVWMKLLDLEGF